MDTYTKTIQIKADVSQAQATLSQLTSTLQHIQSIDIASNMSSPALHQAAQAAKELETHLKNAMSINGMPDLNKFNTSLKMSGQSVSQLSQQLLLAGTSGTKAFAQLSSAVSTMQAPIKSSNAMLKSFATTLKNSFKWEVASKAIHGIEGAFSNALNYVKDLNASLNDIQIVTGASADSMTKFAEQANQIAKSLSTTTKAYTDASLIYFQQGDTQAQAMQKAAITTKAANVAFSASAKEMSEMLTAVWNSYQVGSDQLERYVDIMAKLGSTTATSTEEIATAMQKVAATANTVGVSMEQMSSIIATVSSVTREAPSSIGTSMKTILARMGDLKLGLTLDDDVTLGKVSSSLQAIGVNVLDAQNNLREMGTVIEEIGAKWQLLSKAQQTAIAQVIGGKRQYTQLMALFENMDKYQTNLLTAKTSEGTLNKQAEIYAQSWEAASKRVQTSWETLYSQMFNDKAIIKATDNISKIVDGLSNVIKGMGGMNGVALNLGNTLMTVFNQQIVNSLGNSIDKFSNFMTNWKSNGFLKAFNIGGQNMSQFQEWQSTAYGELLKTMPSAFDQVETPAMAAYLENAQHILQFQKAYVENSHKMTSVQKQETDSMISFYNTVLEKANQTATVAEEGHKQLQNSVKAILTPEMKQILNNTDQTNLAQSFSKYFETNDTSWQAVLTNWGHMSAYAEHFKTSLQDLSEINLRDVARDATVLANTYSFKDNDQGSLNILRQYVNNSGDITKEMATEALNTYVTQMEQQSGALASRLAPALRQHLSDLGVTASEQLVKDLLAGLDSEALKGIAAKLNLDQLKPTRGQQIAQQFTDIARSAMSVANAFNSAKAAGEQFAQGSMTLGSALSSVSSVLMSVAMSPSLIGKIISGVAAGIGAIVGKLEGDKKKAEELIKSQNEQLKGSVKETTEQSSKYQQILTSYMSLLDAYQNGKDVQDELAESAKELGETYGLVGAEIANSTQNYSSFNAELQRTLDLLKGIKQETQIDLNSILSKEVNDRDKANIDNLLIKPNFEEYSERTVGYLNTSVYDLFAGSKGGSDQWQTSTLADVVDIQEWTNKILTDLGKSLGREFQEIDERTLIDQGILVPLGAITSGFNGDAFLSYLQSLGITEEQLKSSTLSVNTIPERNFGSTDYLPFNYQTDLPIFKSDVAHDVNYFQTQYADILGNDKFFAHFLELDVDQRQSGLNSLVKLEEELNSRYQAIMSAPLGKRTAADTSLLNFYDNFQSVLTKTGWGDRLQAYKSNRSTYLENSINAQIAKNLIGDQVDSAEDIGSLYQTIYSEISDILVSTAIDGFEEFYQNSDRNKWTEDMQIKIGQKTMSMITPFLQENEFAQGYAVLGETFDYQTDQIDGAMKFLQQNNISMTNLSERMLKGLKLRGEIVQNITDDVSNKNKIEELKQEINTVDTEISSQQDTVNNLMSQLETTQQEYDDQKKIIAANIAGKQTTDFLSERILETTGSNEQLQQDLSNLPNLNDEANVITLAQDFFVSKANVSEEVLDYIYQQLGFQESLLEIYSQYGATAEDVSSYTNLINWAKQMYENVPEGIELPKTADAEEAAQKIEDLNQRITDIQESGIKAIYEGNWSIEALWSQVQNLMAKDSEDLSDIEQEIVNDWQNYIESHNGQNTVDDFIQYSIEKLEQKKIDLVKEYYRNNADNFVDQFSSNIKTKMWSNQNGDIIRQAYEDINEKINATYTQINENNQQIQAWQNDIKILTENISATGEDRRGAILGILEKYAENNNYDEILEHINNNDYSDLSAEDQAIIKGYDNKLSQQELQLQQAQQLLDASKQKRTDLQEELEQQQKLQEELSQEQSELIQEFLKVSPNDPKSITLQLLNNALIKTAESDKTSKIFADSISNAETNIAALKSYNSSSMKGKDASQLIDLLFGEQEASEQFWEAAIQGGANRINWNTFISYDRQTRENYIAGLDNYYIKGIRQQKEIAENNMKQTNEAWEEAYNNLKQNLTSISQDESFGDEQSRTLDGLIESYNTASTAQDFVFKTWFDQQDEEVKKLIQLNDNGTIDYAELEASFKQAGEALTAKNLETSTYSALETLVQFFELVYNVSDSVATKAANLTKNLKNLPKNNTDALNEMAEMLGYTDAGLQYYDTQKKKWINISDNEQGQYYASQGYKVRSSSKVDQLLESTYTDRLERAKQYLQNFADEDLSGYNTIWNYLSGEQVTEATEQMTHATTALSKLSTAFSNWADQGQKLTSHQTDVLKAYGIDANSLTNLQAWNDAFQTLTNQLSNANSTIVSQLTSYGKDANGNIKSGFGAFEGFNWSEKLGASSNYNDFYNSLTPEQQTIVNQNETFKTYITDYYKNLQTIVETEAVDLNKKMADVTLKSQQTQKDSLLKSLEQDATNAKNAFDNLKDSILDTSKPLTQVQQQYLNKAGKVTDSLSQLGQLATSAAVAEQLSLEAQKFNLGSNKLFSIALPNGTQIGGSDFRSGLNVISKLAGSDLESAVSQFGSQIGLGTTNTDQLLQWLQEYQAMSSEMKQSVGSAYDYVISKQTEFNQNIQDSIDMNWASWTDSLVESLQKVATANQNIANQIIQTWQNVSQTIAQAQLGTMQGQTAVQTFANNPEALALLAVQYLANNPNATYDNLVSLFTSSTSNYTGAGWTKPNLAIDKYAEGQFGISNGQWIYGNDKTISVDPNTLLSNLYNGINTTDLLAETQQNAEALKKLSTEAQTNYADYLKTVQGSESILTAAQFKNAVYYNNHSGQFENTEFLKQSLLNMMFGTNGDLFSFDENGGVSFNTNANAELLTQARSKLLMAAMSYLLDTNMFESNQNAQIETGFNTINNLTGAVSKVIGQGLAALTSTEIDQLKDIGITASEEDIGNTADAQRQWVLNAIDTIYTTIGQQIQNASNLDADNWANSSYKRLLDSQQKSVRNGILQQYLGEEETQKLTQVQGAISALNNEVDNFIKNGKLTQRTQDLLGQLGIHPNSINSIESFNTALDTLKEKLNGIITTGKTNIIKSMFGAETVPTEEQLGSFSVSQTFDDWLTAIGKNQEYIADTDEYNNLKAKWQSIINLMMDVNDIDTQKSNNVLNDNANTFMKTIDALDKSIDKLNKDYDKFNNVESQLKSSLNDLNKPLSFVQKQLMTNAGMTNVNWGQNMADNLNIYTEAAGKAAGAQIALYEAQQFGEQDINTFKTLAENQTEWTNAINQAKIGNYTNLQDWLQQQSTLGDPIKKAIFEIVKESGTVGLTIDDLVTKLAEKSGDISEAISLVWANLNQSVSDAVQAMVSSNESAAQQTISIWQNAANAIAKAKLAAINGTSLGEAFSGDNQGLAFILQNQFGNSQGPVTIEQMRQILSQSPNTINLQKSQPTLAQYAQSIYGIDNGNWIYQRDENGEIIKGTLAINPEDWVTNLYKALDIDSLQTNLKAYSDSIKTSEAKSYSDYQTLSQSNSELLKLSEAQYKLGLGYDSNMDTDALKLYALSTLLGSNGLTWDAANQKITIPDEFKTNNLSLWNILASYLGDEYKETIDKNVRQQTAASSIQSLGSSILGVIGKGSSALNYDAVKNLEAVLGTNFTFSGISTDIASQQTWAKDLISKLYEHYKSEFAGDAQALAWLDKWKADQDSNIDFSGLVNSQDLTKIQELQNAISTLNNEVNNFLQTGKLSTETSNLLSTLGINPETVTDLNSFIKLYDILQSKIDTSASTYLTNLKTAVPNKFNQDTVKSLFDAWSQSGKSIEDYFTETTQMSKQDVNYDQALNAFKSLIELQQQLNQLEETKLQAKYSDEMKQQTEIVNKYNKALENQQKIADKSAIATETLKDKITDLNKPLSAVEKLQTQVVGGMENWGKSVKQNLEIYLNSLSKSTNDAVVLLEMQKMQYSNIRKSIKDTGEFERLINKGRASGNYNELVDFLTQTNQLSGEVSAAIIDIISDTSTFGLSVDQIFDSIESKVSEITDNISNKWAEMADAMAEALNSVLESNKQAVQDVIDSWTNGAQQVLDLQVQMISGQSIAEIFKNDTEGLEKFIQNAMSYYLGQGKSVDVAYNSVRDLITTPGAYFKSEWQEVMTSVITSMLPSTDNNVNFANLLQYQTGLTTQQQEYKIKGQQENVQQEETTTTEVKTPTEQPATQVSEQQPATESSQSKVVDLDEIEAQSNGHQETELSAATISVGSATINIGSATINTDKNESSETQSSKEKTQSSEESEQTTTTTDSTSTSDETTTAKTSATSTSTSSLQSKAQQEIVSSLLDSGTVTIRQNDQEFTLRIPKQEEIFGGINFDEDGNIIGNIPADSFWSQYTPGQDLQKYLAQRMTERLKQNTEIPANWDSVGVIDTIAESLAYQMTQNWKKNGQTSLLVPLATNMAQDVINEAITGSTNETLQTEVASTIDQVSNILSNWAKGGMINEEDLSTLAKVLNIEENDLNKYGTNEARRQAAIAWLDSTQFLANGTGQVQYNIADDPYLQKKLSEARLQLLMPDMGTIQSGLDILDRKSAQLAITKNQPDLEEWQNLISQGQNALYGQEYSSIQLSPIMQLLKEADIQNPNISRSRMLSYFQTAGATNKVEDFINWIQSIGGDSSQYDNLRNFSEQFTQLADAALYLRDSERHLKEVQEDATSQVERYNAAQKITLDQTQEQQILTDNAVKALQGYVANGQAPSWAINSLAAVDQKYNTSFASRWLNAESNSNKIIGAKERATIVAQVDALNKYAKLEAAKLQERDALSIADFISVGKDGNLKKVAETSADTLKDLFDKAQKEMTDTSTLDDLFKAFRNKINSAGNTELAAAIDNWYNANKSAFNGLSAQGTDVWNAFTKASEQSISNSKSKITTLEQEIQQSWQQMLQQIIQAETSAAQAVVQAWTDAFNTIKSVREAAFAGDVWGRDLQSAQDYVNFVQAALRGGLLGSDFGVEDITQLANKYGTNGILGLAPAVPPTEQEMILSNPDLNPYGRYLNYDSNGNLLPLSQQNVIANMQNISLETAKAIWKEGSKIAYTNANGQKEEGVVTKVERIEETTENTEHVVITVQTESGAVSISADGGGIGAVLGSGQTIQGTVNGSNITQTAYTAAAATSAYLKSVRMQQDLTEGINRAKSEANNGLNSIANMMAARNGWRASDVELLGKKPSELSAAEKRRVQRLYNGIDGQGNYYDASGAAFALPKNQQGLQSLIYNSTMGVQKNALDATYKYLSSLTPNYDKSGQFNGTYLDQYGNIVDANGVSLQWDNYYTALDNWESQTSTIFDPLTEGFEACAASMGKTVEELEQYINLVRGMEGLDSLNFSQMTDADKNLWGRIAQSYERQINAVSDLFTLFDPQKGAYKDLGKKTAAEQMKFWEGVTGDLTSYFGNIEGLDANFAKEHASDIAAMSMGSKSAISKIEESLLDKLFKNHPEIDSSKFGGAKGLADIGKGTKFGDKLSPEDTTKLNNLYKDLGYNKDLFNMILDAKGITAQWADDTSEVSKNLKNAEKNVNGLNRELKNSANNAERTADATGEVKENTQASAEASSSQAEEQKQGASQQQPVEVPVTPVVEETPESPELPDLEQNINLSYGEVPQAPNADVAATITYSINAPQPSIGQMPVNGTMHGEGQITAQGEMGSGSSTVTYDMPITGNIPFIQSTGGGESGGSGGSPGEGSANGSGSTGGSPTAGTGEASTEAGDNRGYPHSTDPTATQPSAPPPGHRGESPSTAAPEASTAAPDTGSAVDTSTPTGYYNNRPDTPGGTPEEPDQGGGGGGGKKDEKDLKNREDEIERYHEILDMLEVIEQELDRIDKLKTRTWGRKHLEEINNEINALKHQTELQKEYINEIEAFYEKEVQRMKDVGGLFNPDGTLANYYELMNEWLDELDAAYQAFNASGQGDEDKKALEKAEKLYEERKKWIESYEETLDLMRTEANELLEIQNKISEATLEKITYKVDLKIEFNESDLDILDYFTDKLEDILDLQDEMFNTMMSKAVLYEDNLSTYSDAIMALERAHQEFMATNGESGLNDSDYATQLQEYRDEITNTLGDLEDLRRELLDVYGDTLDLANDELERHISLLEHVNEIASTYLEILGLMGQEIDFEKLSNFYDLQYESGLRNLEVQKQWVEELEKELQYYQLRMDSGYELTETEQAQWNSLVDTYIDAHEEMLSTTQDTLDALKEAFDAHIEYILKKLSQVNVVDYYDISQVADAYSYWNDEQQRYLATGKQLYEISKLNRQIEGSIMDATTQASKERLKALEDVINAQAESNQLTQYQIDMYQLQYELALALQQLEEANNKKSTVRLTRDANGNYGYQYTADQDSIDEAEQNYEDVLEKIRTLTVEHADEMANAYIQARQDMEDQLSELSELQVTDYEAWVEASTRVTEHYTEMMEYYRDQYTQVAGDMNNNLTTINHHYKDNTVSISEMLRNALNEDIQQMMNKQNEYVAAVQNAIALMGGAWTEYEARIKVITETTETSYDNMIASIERYNKIMDQSVRQANKVIETFDETAQGIHSATIEWENHIRAVGGVIGAYEGLIVTLGTTLRSMADLENEYTGAATSYTVVKPTVDTTNYRSESTRTTTSSYTGGGGDNGGSQKAKKEDPKLWHVAGLDETFTSKDEALKAREAQASTQIGKYNELKSKGDPSYNQYYGEAQKWRAAEISQYFSGGLADYTGPAWLDGTFNKPELVLNPHDTENMLDMISMLHAMSPQIMDIIHNNTVGMLYGLSGLTSQSVYGATTEIQQNIQIQADFPNVQERNEIVEAFNDLINQTAQYINRR